MIQKKSMQWILHQSRLWFRSPGDAVSPCPGSCVYKWGAMYENDAPPSGRVDPGPPARTAASREPGTVELFNCEGSAAVLVLCDHAGRRIPPWLGDLGLPDAERARHIGFDLGAADLTRALARRLDAPAVLCHVSRLVIDPNREPGDPTSIPQISDGTFVPGNQDLGAAEVRRRLAVSFVPYHRAVARQIARLRRRVGVPAILSIHSFTPVMRRVFRPWQVAVLYNADLRLARPVLEALKRDRSLQVGDNEPYSGRYPVGYSIPFHAARPGFPHVTFEVRQDLIESAAGAEAWAERLHDALGAPLADRGLYVRRIDAAPSDPPA
jgi:predicted N-formylglutamate amidohydrolase